MATLSLGSHLVITGGTFMQVMNNNNFQEQWKTPWRRLEAAVAPAAFHNSAQRFDPPRCHPNTRVAVMIELRDLALRWGDVGKARILWLNGPAGAGKSAIAQSFCEECFPTHFLLASFFFSRFDSTRNNAKSLVATLAYQIYGRVPAYNQSLILAAIESDPLVFERTIDAQFQSLIMDPLQDLIKAGYFPNTSAPQLIVIDGLDECSRGAIQIGILRALEKITMQPDCPFVFLVASRPEHDIEMFFRSCSLGPLLHRLVLDHSYHPEEDVELFLREKIQETCETHPLKNSIPRGWPSRKAIDDLVQKSSGQFIYASVVVNYVTSSRHYPPDRLDIVRRLCPPKRDLPFAELDALYSHILSCVDDIPLVLRILRILLLFDEADAVPWAGDVEQLCDLNQGECVSALCDLQSLVEVTGRGVILLLHKSLPDYLQDPARSHDYHIDTHPRAVIPIVLQCLQYISNPKLLNSLSCLPFISRHLNLVVSNVQLRHKDLASFSLVNSMKPIYDIYSTQPEDDEVESELLMRELLPQFVTQFFDRLCILEGTGYEYVYHHHLRRFPEVLKRYSYEHERSLLLENDVFTVPMIILFILSQHLETHSIPPNLSEFLQQVPFKELSQIPLEDIEGLENLYCCAAQHCINSLMHDSNPGSAAAGLGLLPLILPNCRLTPNLNDLCLRDRPFAYAITGEHGLSALADSAYEAMQDYRDRYRDEEEPLSDIMDED